uniref:HD-ZIP protein N-terminal domain-containing protein n=1 Tax=Aegilops tauschii subsp. strangulata TaxID=200361 RepID=A0A453QKU0_AEGTS
PDHHISTTEHHHRPPTPGTLRSDRVHRRSTMHRAAGLDLGLGLGLGLASQGSLTSSTTTASSSPASHWTAALSSVVGAQESYGLHQYAGQPRKEEPGMRTSTSPESGVSAGTKRGLERTGSGVSRGGAATAGSDEDDDGGDGAGGRKKLRLSKDQAAVLEECFKTHSTLNPVSPFSFSVLLRRSIRQDRIDRQVFVRGFLPIALS